ncbi:MAG: PHP domain-containing protein [Myxococcales bacterium]|nr:PHP domain-containing protein [Myxococcales bacterium]
MRCDFHVHSNRSDGTLSPAELADEAVREGVQVMALTDHDNVRGVAAAAERGHEVGVEVLAGIEVSVSEPDTGRQMHILGLGIDPARPELLTRLERVNIGRDARAKRIVALLAERGVELPLEAVRAEAGPGVIGRPHVARALVRLGVCADPDEAFSRYLRRGRPAFVPLPGLSAREAIDLIHAAGGISVLAHPLLSLGVDAAGGIERFVEALVADDLDGLEVWHPSHTPRRRRRLRRLAELHGLVASGGSDFHGPARLGIRLGRGRGNLDLGEPVLRAIRERIESRRAQESALSAGS